MPEAAFRKLEPTSGVKMPSPFPGMDPFIEPQVWEEFHNTFLEGMADVLVPLVRPDYVVRRERRVYVGHDDDPGTTEIIPDASIVRTAVPSRREHAGAGGTAVLSPVQITLPIPVEHRETFLTVREARSLEVVTVIELLSPSNKRRGSTGRDIYLAKRNEVLASSAHFIEIDLLRAAGRMPTTAILPKCDYCVILSRAPLRPRADAWCWSVRDALPGIPVPLTNGHPDVEISLQEVFEERFDRLGYDYTLSYAFALRPPLDPEDAAWVSDLIARRPT